MNDTINAKPWWPSWPPWPVPQWVFDARYAHGVSYRLKDIQVVRRKVVGRALAGAILAALQPAHSTVNANGHLLALDATAPFDEASGDRVTSFVFGYQITQSRCCGTSELSCDAACIKSVHALSTARSRLQGQSISLCLVRDVQAKAMTNIHLNPALDTAGETMQPCQPTAVGSTARPWRTLPPGFATPGPALMGNSGSHLWETLGPAGRKNPCRFPGARECDVSDTERYVFICISYAANMNLLPCCPR